jgi:hypothetical protein
MLTLRERQADPLQQTPDLRLEHRLEGRTTPRRQELGKSTHAGPSRRSQRLDASAESLRRAELQSERALDRGQERIVLHASRDVDQGADGIRDGDGSAVLEVGPLDHRAAVHVEQLMTWVPRRRQPQLDLALTRTLDAPQPCGSGVGDDRIIARPQDRCHRELRPCLLRADDAEHAWEHAAPEAVAQPSRDRPVRDSARSGLGSGDTSVLRFGELAHLRFIV